ncbi:isoaspartyl peptidase/L-asparaginase [Waterburya agarophytonicola K14]|uniref:Isoaspartyl peptidase/L-asparaginase n=1 Tax=Waterburya agarophytonicola KI4 TaxID=2874699 RepID=A0A964FHE9_9CYAN|nr:isoaspartyl peptidase/L-asparaginase [Waterburya agarophytonicola]MCC0179007.1 isoaspartyl peptidase/L-asparaginase [Waterburya agarophytonicola KI4]
MSSNTIQPKLIIHGGAGGHLKSEKGETVVREALHSIIREVYTILTSGGTAVDAVIKGCQLLEDRPTFNAGTGSVLQSDGQIRMSAALMDGSRQRFSGIINVSRVQHPIELVQFLQGEEDRVLSDYGAQELLRELNVPIYDPLVDIRLQEWIQERDGNFNKDMAGVVAEQELVHEPRKGTIGVVALDCNGKIAAGTSTGGKGLERIGRVSDSAMPAGNYADASAGVSCTGIGEDIMEECLAAKVAIRVTDGMSLVEAMTKSMTESRSRGRDLGAIAIASDGTIAWGKTSEVILAAYHDGQEIGDTINWDNDELIGSK